MKKYLAAGLIFGVCFLSLGSQTLTAAPDNVATAQKALENLDNSEQNRKIEELERALGNLERQVDRLDDKIEKMDHDLKEVRRKAYA